MPPTRERLAGLGRTEPEIELWLALEDVSARIAQLPDCTRAQGWGSAPGDMPDEGERRERLARLGMTGQELELWYATAELAGRIFELPEPGATTDERHEIVHGHRVQDALLAPARPPRRQRLNPPRRPCSTPARK